MILPCAQGFEYALQPSYAQTLVRLIKMIVPKDQFGKYLFVEKVKYLGDKVNGVNTTW